MPVIEMSVVRHVAHSLTPDALSEVTPLCSKPGHSVPEVAVAFGNRRRAALRSMPDGGSISAARRACTTLGSEADITVTRSRREDGDPLAGSSWSRPDTVAGFARSAPNDALLRFATVEINVRGNGSTIRRFSAGSV